MPNGKVFVPEGISVYGGLEDTDYMENLANINAQIKAAAIYWHANTIRLQVAESNLFSAGPGRHYNVEFLNELIHEVDLAHSYNQAVVINDQTEFTNNTPAPTDMTVKFWRIMAKTFGHQPYVIFDLFNEPRLDSLKTNSPTFQNKLVRQMFSKKFSKTRFRYRGNPVIKNAIWNLWKYGGYVNRTHYIGMQTLVNQIRAEGVNNLIWVEGPFWGQSLPEGRYLLSGGNIEYSFHHINLNRVSDWKFIGRLASHHAVVDGEWSQYQSPWQECYAEAPITVPQYLQYLKVHGIGLIAWSLQAGSLLKGNPSIVPANNNSPRDPKRAAALQIPSRFSKQYRCNNQFGQGAGKLIKQYFRQNSLPI